MKKVIRPFALAALCAALVPAFAAQDVVERLQQGYQSEGSAAFSADAGAALWTREFRDEESGQMRSCATCHTTDLNAVGKHAKTGKRIDPMRPAVNAERLTDPKHIEKWFLRNCKWTYGRECTPQEKGDFLDFIQGK